MEAYSSQGIAAGNLPSSPRDKRNMSFPAVPPSSPAENSSADPTRPPLPVAHELEAFLRQLLEPAPAAPTGPRTPPAPGPGRPPTLPAVALWAGLLVGILRGLAGQRDIWRLLTCHGLWDFPRFEVTDAALYQRCQRLDPTQMAAFLETLTARLHTQVSPGSATDLAPFAPEIMAIDHTVLDPVLRKRKLLRELPRGDAALLPGALGCVFDVRRQQWHRVEYTEMPILDMRASVLRLAAGLPRGSLLLFDLGYFSFWGFDTLTERGYHYVSRLREKLSYTVEHVLYDGPAGGAVDPEAVHLRECLIYLGAHRSDRAAHPVRLIELTVGGQTFSYLTNILDPRVLPARQVAELYRRRWDIERGFDLIKTELGLSLFWSSHPNPVLLQVYATLIIAQVLLALRNQVAQQAQVDVREVSMPLLIRWMPRLAAEGKDPVAEFVRVGRRAGYIRPFRGKCRALPEVAAEAYALPPTLLPVRPPRYRTGPREEGRAPARKPPNKQPTATPYGPYGRPLSK